MRTLIVASVRSSGELDRVCGGVSGRRSRRPCLLEQAFAAESPQRALEVGSPEAKSLEVRIEKRQEPHRRPSEDGRRPAARHKQSDLAENVPRADRPTHVDVVDQDVGFALLDCVQHVAEIAVRDDCCALRDLDLGHRLGEQIELGGWKPSEDLERRDSLRVHVGRSVSHAHMGGKAIHRTDTVWTQY